MMNAHDIQLSPSAVPGFFIRFNLQAGVELIQTTEQINHRHQFKDGFVIQS